MAKGPLSTLDRRLTEVSKRLTRGVEKLFSEVIEEIGREVVGDSPGTGTPVDTGFARANWRPSLNTPASSPISFLDPTGKATISRIIIVGLRWQVGDVFYITNRAPYIGLLNSGSSPQAPAGFVKRAAKEGLRRATQRRNRAGIV
jgi:hypothetical protein